MATVTCHTAGCGNAEQPIVIGLLVEDDDGIPLLSHTVACGPCGQPITDVVLTDEEMSAQS
jgi:hypothetical protein